MEKEYMTDGEQRRIERLIMIIYTMYSMAMIARTVSYGWNNWLNYVLLIGIASSWIVYVSRCKNYVFRAKFTTIMLEMSLLIYSHVAQELTGGIPLIIAFVIFLCLYERLEIVWITITFGCFMFIYHGAMLRTIPLSDFQDMLTLLQQIANVAVVEVVAYIWVKRKNESDRRIQGVIKELKAAEHSKDEFLANVSHEIRTPINTICGMSEAVLREDVPQSVKEKIGDVQTAGQSLMAVVSNILDFSELQSGKMELEEESYNITSTINDLITMFQALKSDKRIELIVDCDANMPNLLFGDEKKLRRIIMNLVDNAIKFTEEGCVSIGFGFRKESYGINLQVTVKDTGIGIAEESLAKICTGFHQVDAGTKRSGSGVGLGLAIARALIRKMGGTMTIKSRQGKGTTVKFVIPQAVMADTALVSIQDKNRINAATYFDMEKFEMLTIRDEYTQMMSNMIEQLKVRCQMCRNLAELQRRDEKEHYTHIFIGLAEYREAQDYFDLLAERAQVIVVLDYAEEKWITGTAVKKLYKPFYILSVVSVMNGTGDARKGQTSEETEKFTAPDAHIMVVDDNRMNLRVADSMLSRYRIKTTLVNSGREALEKIESCNYDFVFMDHMMPEMDGVETMQRIRQKPGSYYKNVPIVALTANAVAGTREMLLSKGFNDFLEKPIERSVLERVLRRNLAPEKIVAGADEPVRVEVKQTQEVQKEEQIIEKMVEDIVMQTEKTLLELLEEEGLNTQKGMMYCGGEESYIEILQSFCEEYEEMYNALKEQFTEKDWENYIITVHGIKSAMGSIGAEEIQEMAKQLEYAGKEKRISYILENNDGLLEKYLDLFRRLISIEALGLTDCVEPEDNIAGIQGEREERELRTLQKEEFSLVLEEMENAMYALDGDTLLELLNGISGCEYAGKALDDVVGKAIRKVEMSDYMSAVELLAKQMTVQSDEEG
ncbi:MAG: response regulator [Lachnospiraceae bacterium]|nr:response regulator [Lachnospiraceae bacterium]